MKRYLLPGLLVLGLAMGTYSVGQPYKGDIRTWGCGTEAETVVSLDASAAALAANAKATVTTTHALDQVRAANTARKAEAACYAARNFTLTGAGGVVLAAVAGGALIVQRLRRRA